MTDPTTTTTTQNPAAGAPNPAPAAVTPPPAAVTPPAGIPWLAGASNDEVAFVQSKGWDKEAAPPVDQIVRSYHNLQKLFGADKAGNTVVLPGEGADETATNAFYNKLGRPETVDKYSAGDFDGMSQEMSKGLKETAHKLGLTEKQLAGLHEWNKTATAGFMEQTTQEAQIEFAAQESALKKEWGAAYDQNLQHAKEATTKLGWTKEQVDAMQIGIGYDGVMKLAAQIGKSVGESTFVNTDGGRSSGNSNVMTPEQARSELNKLTNDKEFQKAWMDKLHPKHQEMINRKSQLSAWAVGAK